MTTHPIDLMKLATSDDPRVMEIVRAATALGDARAQAEQAEYALKRTDEWTKLERALQTVWAEEEKLKAAIEGRAVEEAATSVVLSPMGSSDVAARARKDMEAHAEELRDESRSITDRVAEALAREPSRKFRAAEIAELVDVSPQQAYSALLRVVGNGDAHAAGRGLFRASKKMLKERAA